MSSNNNSNDGDTATKASSSSSLSLSAIRVAAATRIHLGQAKHPPSADDMQKKIDRFVALCTSLQPELVLGVIAVDATRKFDHYDLVAAVQTAVDQATAATSQQQEQQSSKVLIVQVLPVTPWGRFVPALNALTGYAAGHNTQPNCILFVSAETTASRRSLVTLLSHMVTTTNNNNSNKNNQQLDDSVLVVGARLPGHDFCPTTTTTSNTKTQEEPRPVELNGRTTPWNTLAVWNLSKLCLTGFLMVSDGHLTDDATDPSYGVEEACAIAAIQQLLGSTSTSARAKLVSLPDVAWEQTFDGDPERERWHTAKMQSKLQRAGKQLQLTGLTKGLVWHYHDDDDTTTNTEPTLC